MKAGSGTILMRLLRRAEAFLPPLVLRGLLLPLMVPLALRDLRWRSKMMAGWHSLQVHPPGLAPWFRECLRFHLVRVLNFWPDRLASDRWLSRVEFPGLEAIRRLQAAGKPVVIVCLHHGPIHVLRYLLRAGGVACAMVVLESRAERLAVRQWKDSLSPPPDVPNVFCRDELKAMQRFVQSGGCLLVAADYGRGKTCEVPFGPALITVASGAFRLAASTGATVFPLTICETRPWCFRVEADAGVPADLGVQAMAERVLESLSEKIFLRPALMHPQLADSVRPSPRRDAVKTK